MDLTGKVVVVTGAARGQGEDLGLALPARRARDDDDLAVQSL